MMPVDRRPEMLLIAAMSEARPAVIARLHRENEKPSHWPRYAISKLCLQHCQGRWPEFKALAMARIMRTPRLKAEWDREGMRYEAAMAKRHRPLCVLPRLAV
jgi:hypothetical protein